MDNIDYEEYDFNVKGIIKVNSPEGVIEIKTPQLKEGLLSIEAINRLLELGKSIKSRVKGNKLLEPLTQKISGKIEIISHEAVR